mgnify:CR=1 FL=1|jgi:RNA polymerase subunit RPABC4/transcription elongation factor Spt4
MKYKKCVKCGLNYVLEKEDICDICKAEEKNKRKDTRVLCPFCCQSLMDEDDIMCKSCAKKNSMLENSD